MGTSVHERVLDFDLTDYRFEGLHFIRLLGKSQFPVWEATDTNTTKERKVAVKVFMCYEDDRYRKSLDAHLENEVDALVSLRAHPSVIRFFYRKAVVLYVHQPTRVLYQSPEDAQRVGVSPSHLDRAYFNFVVMELVPGGSLDEEYFSFAQNDPATACKQLAGVADGLVHLHKHQLHRDIKPANLLYDRAGGTIKLADLGLARAVASVTSTGISGTIQYLAPECFNPSEPDTPKRDVYAYAVSLFQIFTQRLPFDVELSDDAPQQVRIEAWQKAHSSKKRPTLFSDCQWAISFDLSQIIKQAMSPKPDDRPTTEQLRGALLEEADRLTGKLARTNLHSPASDMPPYLDDKPVRTIPNDVRGTLPTLSVWSDHTPISNEVRGILLPCVWLPFPRSQPIVLPESLQTRIARILTGDIRPDDYLPVPDEVITFVDRAEARGGVKLLPEYRRRMISQLALQHHHAGTEVLVRHAPDGVIVLATGPDEVDQVAQTLSPEQQALVSVEHPPTPFE